MQVVQGIERLDAVQKPEELEVQLAIKLGSEAGAFLVSLSGEAQMQVTMKWKLSHKKDIEP
ncbi:MAG: CU044_2847 family protein [Methylococcales bacterium]